MLAPFHSMVEVGRKLDPFTVRIKSGLPALTEDGLIDKAVGAGLDVGLMANSAVPEFPPPGGGFVMLSWAEPELAISVAVICTCS